MANDVSTSLFVSSLDGEVFSRCQEEDEEKALAVGVACQDIDTLGGGGAPIMKGPPTRRASMNGSGEGS